MNTPAWSAVEWGTIPALVLCWAAYWQRRAWRRGPRNPRQAQAWQHLALVYPYSQLGVRVGLDGFVYANASGRCLGQWAGATVTVAPSVPVTKIKPSIGWATIRFADGTEHRAAFGMRNLAEARMQERRFNTGAQQHPAASQFRRTRPARMP